MCRPVPVRVSTAYRLSHLGSKPIILLTGSQTQFLSALFARAMQIYDRGDTPVPTRLEHREHAPDAPERAVLTVVTLRYCDRHVVLIRTGLQISQIHSRRQQHGGRYWIVEPRARRRGGRCSAPGAARPR